MVDTLGVNALRPPYRYVGCMDGTFRLQAIKENWKIDTKDHGRYERYFVYWVCRADDNGTVFFNRTVRKKYQGKIPDELKHASVEKVDEYFSVDNANKLNGKVVE